MRRATSRYLRPQRHPQRQRQWKHRGAYLATLFTLGILSTLLAACAVPPPAPFVVAPAFSPPCCAPTPTPTPRAPVEDSKQVLHAGLGPVSTLDPALIDTTYDYEVSQLIFPGLIQLDTQLRPIPWAASGWSISTDGATYRFTLRPNLMWSDGTPISAADYAYAINRTVNPCTASPIASFLFAIAQAPAFNAEPCVGGSPAGALTTLIGDSVRAQGQTLTITLAHPAVYFLSALSYPASYAVPRRLIAQYGQQWIAHLADGGGLGGDLFKLTTWDQAHNRLTLQRNDRYWGAKSRLREIDFTLVQANVDQAADALYTAYVGGSGDVSPLSKAQYASARLRADFHETPSLAFQSLVLNWAAPPFDDINMRKAFAIAIDKQTLAANIQSNTVTPTNHLVPKGILGYNPDLSSPDGSSGLTGNSQSARDFALTYAKVHCRGGQLSACPPVTLLLLANPVNATLATALQTMWTTALPGYPIQTQLLSLNELIPRFGAGKFQIANISLVMDYPDPQDILSTCFLPGGAQNWGKVNLEAASNLIRTADIDQNNTQRLSEYSQAEQLLVNAVAWIPLFQAKNFYVARSTVAAYAITALGVPSSDTWQKVYISKS